MDIERGVGKEFFDMSEQAYTYVILGGRLAGASAIQGIRGLDKNGAILNLPQIKGRTHFCFKLSWTRVDQNTVLFLQNTGSNVFTSQIILNSMNRESNKIISLRKLNPQYEGDGKRQVSQETAELPKGLNR
ncbi:MAG: hypothetical protein ACXU9K_13555 [Thermodesulfobacteriota bacterium]